MSCFLARNTDFGLLHCIKLHDAGEEGRVLSESVVLDVAVEEGEVSVGVALPLEHQWNLLLEIAQDEVKLQSTLLLQVQVAPVNVRVGHVEEESFSLRRKPH